MTLFPEVPFTRWRFFEIKKCGCYFFFIGIGFNPWGNVHFAMTSFMGNVPFALFFYFSVLILLQLQYVIVATTKSILMVTFFSTENVCCSVSFFSINVGIDPWGNTNIVIWQNYLKIMYAIYISRRLLFDLFLNRHA